MIGPLLGGLLMLAGIEGPMLAPSAEANSPDPAEVMRIPEDLRQEFRAYVIDRATDPQQRMERLVDFLFMPEGLGMRYAQDATYTVAEAYQTRTANCLSFTLLTVVLAREAGLQAYGQQIAQSLAWRREGNTIFRTIHVNAGIRLGQRNLTVDVAWDRVIASDPPARVSDARLLAHYYNNRSVELMAAGQLDAARAHAAVSVQLDPAYATSWSNAGVLNLRAGLPDQAERDYRHALVLDPLHPSALINLGAHYQRLGKPERAAVYLRRVEALHQRDPLHHLILALDFEKQGDFEQAVSHYRRAIRLHAEEYRFHAGLARAYTQTGDLRKAARAQRRADQLIQSDTRRMRRVEVEPTAAHGR